MKNVLPDLYLNSTFIGKLKKQPKIKLAVFSDIDGTLYQKGAKEDFNVLFETLKSSGIPICYATGRTWAQVKQQDGLYLPDLCLANVGTEIWVKKQDGGFEKDWQFHQYLARRWQKSNLLAKLRTLVDLNLFDLTWQKEGNPDSLKISLYFKGPKQELRNFRTIIKSIINAGAGVVFSSDRANFNVDILPLVNSVTGKALPIRYLKNFLDFKSIAAGNSGNDIEMFFRSSSSAIIINRTPEAADVLDWVLPKVGNRYQFLKFKTGKSWRSLYIGSKGENGPRAILKALAAKEFNPEFADIIRSNWLKVIEQKRERGVY